MDSENGSPSEPTVVSSEAIESSPEERPVCFVLMPISDHPDYAPGHFKRVFEDIFQPACNKAGFRAVRADEVGQTNLIHLDVLQKLLDSPMALCDLSSRNPNVLFELGLRQAFDKPVVLVRDKDTLDIFDIAPLRYTEYRKERLYHEVVQDQNKIARAIKETKGAFDNGEGINSIVRLLSLTQPAALVDVQEASKDPVLQIVRAEVSELRTEVREALRMTERTASATRSPSREDYARRTISELNHLLTQIRSNLEAMESSGAEPDQLSRSLKRARDAAMAARTMAESNDMKRLATTALLELDDLQATYGRLKENEEEDFDDIPF